MESYIHEWVVQLGDEDQVVAYRAYKNLEEKVIRAGAPGFESRRAELAASLAAGLVAKGEPPKNKEGKPKGPPPPLYSAGARSQLCRLLSYVAGASEVPALVEALGDMDVREMARFALERDTSEAATDALIAALEQVGPIFRAGVVNTLGTRQGPRVLDALQKTATEDANLEIRLVAVEALANIPEPSSAAIVMAAAKCPGPSHKRRAYKTAVRLARTLAGAGHKSEAQEIYRAIQTGDADAAQKKAAGIGLKALG